MPSPRLHMVRSFSWGLLLIGDHGSADLPGEPPTAQTVATATQSAVAIAVRHAQDAELGDESAATVSVDLFVGSEPDGATDFTTTLNFTTGALDVGDAQAFDQVEIGPGRWHLGIACRPAQHPDQVAVWLNLAAG